MKNCLHCGVVFSGRGNKKYCSNKCRIDFHVRAQKIKLSERGATELEKAKEHRNKRSVAWYERTKEIRRATSAEKYRNDDEYRTRALARQAAYNERTRNTKNERERRKYRELREAVLVAYGSKCACCGEATLAFLCIDHINGGGSEHRRALRAKGISAGAGFYKWLQKNDYPEGFQVLCHNCNMAKGFYGSCPHSHSLKLEA
jgi:hypothetical protein